MLQNLQHLCATLPQGEAEVWLQSGLVNISLHWHPEERPQGKLLEKPQGPAGLYFLLNGQNEEVQVVEWNEEVMLQTEAVQMTNSPLSIDIQTNSVQAVKTEADEKPNRQLKTLKRMLNYLQLHYAFRYNRLTDRTECVRLSVEVGSDEAHQQTYQPADQRMLNSISLQVMQAGIPCWDRDIKRYVESADIASYHPFTSYMEHLPQWGGKDRVTPPAQRVFDDAVKTSWPPLALSIWTSSTACLPPGCRSSRT